MVSILQELTWRGTYSSILGLLSVTALQRDAVTLVLETLGSNETLNLGGLGVWLLALTLWLNLTADNELADLEITEQNFVSNLKLLTLCTTSPTDHHLSRLREICRA